MKKILIALLLICTVSSCTSKKQQRIPLKIMSYNIRHGVGLDTIFDLSRSAAIIKAQAPDLCALQEIDHHCRRSDSLDQTGILATETGLQGTFGKFMDFDGGQYGMATLVKGPVISSKILPLPDGIHEPRSSIVQEVEITKGYSIVFANVHFDWIGGKEGSDSRVKQAKALVEYLNTLEKATIITGDFNCTPDSPTMNYFAEQGFVFVPKGDDRLSFQGGEKVEIDHLIYRNSGTMEFKTKTIRLLDEPVVSDHRPLVAELEVTLKD